MNHWIDEPIQYSNHQSSIIDDYERPPRLHQISHLASQGSHAPGSWRADEQFHLHGFERHHHVPFGDLVPFTDVQRADRCRHRRGKRQLVVMRS